MKTKIRHITVLILLACLASHCKKNKEEKEVIVSDPKHEWKALSTEKQQLLEDCWGFIYENKIHLISNGDITDIVAYDIQQKKWISEHLILPAGFDCFSRSMVIQHNNKVYIAGGTDLNENITKSFWELDLTNSQWKKLPDLPLEMKEGKLFIFENTLYLGFATGSSTGMINQQKIYSFSLTAKTWSDKIIELNINGGTCGIFFQIGEDIFFGNGYGHKVPINPTEFYKYNLRSGNLNELANSPVSFISTAQNSTIVFNKKGFPFNHRYGYYYDPASNTWTKTTTPPKDDRDYTVNYTFVINNRIISFTRNGVAFEYL